MNLSQSAWGVRRNREDYERAVPVAISWDRDRILEFLKVQYEAGVPKAEKLLKLHLWLETQKKVDLQLQNGENCTEQQLKDLVGNANEYPASIRKMVLDDHDEGKRRFEIAGVPRVADVEDVEELPF